MSCFCMSHQNQKFSTNWIETLTTFKLTDLRRDLLKFRYFLDQITNCKFALWSENPEIRNTMAYVVRTLQNKMQQLVRLLEEVSDFTSLKYCLRRIGIFKAITIWGITYDGVHRSKTDYEARGEVYGLTIYWKKYERTKILIPSDSRGTFKVIASSQTRSKLALEMTCKEIS